MRNKELIKLSAVVLTALFTNGIAVGQDWSVLHYTETSGFDHNTRNVSLEMFNALGSENGFAVEDDQTGDAFNTLENLENYTVIVFSNTSGDNILNGSQRANFEAYMENGGAYIGIHAASDTYRHSTANGSNTGTWDWYAEMLGASVQNSPNHTSANYSGVMNHVGSHPSTMNLPDPWNKTEEYYYWENGYFGNTNESVLEVESTGSQSYDAERPMSWYRILPEGGRVFYTALGHASSNYTDDENFRNHIRDALLWAALDQVTGIADVSDEFQVFPNPAEDELNIQWGKASPAKFQVLGITGQEIFLEGNLVSGLNAVAVSNLKAGLYLLRITSGEGVDAVPFLVK